MAATTSGSRGILVARGSSIVPYARSDSGQSAVICFDHTPRAASACRSETPGLSLPVTLKNVASCRPPAITGANVKGTQNSEATGAPATAPPNVHLYYSDALDKGSFANSACNGSNP